MKLVEVEAVEDRSRAEGGHAVILLRGIAHRPASVSFALKPGVAEGDDAAEPAVEGLTGLHPLDITMTADGMAISIGPDIAESVLFVPGAVVEITLPELGVRGEFLWPAVTPLARPKRRNIMIRRTSGEPLPRTTIAGTPPAAPEPATPAIASAQAASPEPEHLSDPEKTTAPKPEQHREQQPEPTIVIPAALQSTQIQPLPTTIATARRPVVLSSALPRRPLSDPAPDAEIHLPAPLADAPRQTAPSPSHTAPAVPSKTEPAVDIAPTAIERDAPEPAPLQPTLSSGGASRPRSAASISTGSAVALAAASLVAAQVIALRALNLGIVQRHVAAAVPAVQAPVEPVAPSTAEPTVPAIISNPRGVYEVIAPGPRSPRGVDAGEVSPAKALQLAHALLHGSEAERDPEEAAYWLKHYLAGAPGGDHVRIALTQLGSAYAQPVRGQSDFASARIVWELSGALADPVAMCFLGAMHEHGLGTTRAPEIAATWYERAATVGRACASGPMGSGSAAR